MAFKNKQINLVEPKQTDTGELWRFGKTDDVIQPTREEGKTVTNRVEDVKSLKWSVMEKKSHQ